MPNPYFAFKKFTVYHDRCAMKVGTDGVLLGAWTDLSESRFILDVGTGTGLIALMMAQRCPEAFITAIDLDEEAVEQAKDNINASPWSDRIQAEKQDVCCYCPDDCFDTIVSNPPYFINSLRCADNQRNTARHADTLDMNRLLRKVADLLSTKGRFSLVIPAEQVDELVSVANREGLFLSRHTAVVTRPGLAPKRALLELRKEQMVCRQDELVVELERHVYSKDYIALTKDFYLKM